MISLLRIIFILAFGFTALSSILNFEDMFDADDEMDKAAYFNKGMLHLTASIILCCLMIWAFTALE